jgi:hypothetical protein
MKTNLINLDTSRDNLIVNRAHFNPKAAEIRSMAILNDENKENIGSFEDELLKSKLRQKLSNISGFKDPLRSKLTDYGEMELDIRSIKHGNYPYTLDNIREEESSFEHYNHHNYVQKYGDMDLETSSNRNQNRGFNQYLYQKEPITERSHEYLSTLNNSSVEHYD